jgi:hypothetical protein
MSIVGIPRSNEPVEVALLSEDGDAVTVVAGLEEFWAAPAGFLSREPAGEILKAADAEVEIERLGVLTNRVVTNSARLSGRG